MSIFCKLLGHMTNENVISGHEYMEVTPYTIDGIGREHAFLYAQCPRCDKMYQAGKIHRPKEWFDGKLTTWNDSERRFTTIEFTREDKITKELELAYERSTG